LLTHEQTLFSRRLSYILYLTSLGLVKGPIQTLCAPYNIPKIKKQAKNEQKIKIFFLTLRFFRFAYRRHKTQHITLIFTSTVTYFKHVLIEYDFQFI